MDENPQIIRDLPHFDSGDYTWEAKWYPGLTYVVGAVIKNNPQESQQVDEEELGE